MSKTALICGGGIGGLSSAIQLLQRGWHVTVLEQATAIREVGAGIQLSANAAKVLDSIGLLKPIERTAFRPKALQMRDGYNGKLIAQLKLSPAINQRWGGNYYNIHRADLIDVLYKAVVDHPNSLLINDYKVSKYSQTENSVSVFDAEDREYTADMLIGADGIHSIIREQMLGKQQARYSGHTAWRLTLPTESLGQFVPEETATVWFGNDRHAVSYRLRNGELCNFVGVVENSFWQQESWTQQGDKLDCLRDFEGWHPIITKMITEGESFYKWALMDRPVLSQWQDKRIILLGDACHPMLPFMAQGASMAIEDGCVLARLLEQHAVETAFEKYTDIRLPRVTAVQKLAKNNAQLYHNKGRLMPYIERFKLGVGSKLLPNVAAARFDWLYGYDATTDNLDI